MSSIHTTQPVSLKTILILFPHLRLSRDHYFPFRVSDDFHWLGNIFLITYLLKKPLPYVLLLGRETNFHTYKNNTLIGDLVIAFTFGVQIRVRI
jgi:hypothetical protein